MSQLPLPGPANDPAAPPLPPEAPKIDLHGVLGAAAANTDDIPTIISKAMPNQNLVTLGATEAALGGSLHGRTLAHFELLDPIGVGGMAAVIRARDKLLDRFVALKILPPEMATDPEHVQRFHQEARAAAKLDHENIARVYYCGEDQKLHFIAFEFVEGQNLRTVMERRGKLPVKDAVHYLLQIATGLAHAASRGVVHRDIKPSNIIIMPNGRAKLVDMGLARSLATRDNRQLTQSGVTLGTFDYISPEQALEPRDADVRSDIYSLGCTFYHMLTGQPPVPEGTAARKLHHHQHVAPIDPRQLNAEIPDEVAAIVQRMMAKDPKQRYQRAEHLVQHLLQVAQKLGGAEVPDGVFFVDAPLPSPPRRRSLALAAGAVAVLVIFILAVALVPPRAATVASPPAKMAVVPNKDESPIKGSIAGVAKETPVPEQRRVASEEEFAEALSEDRVEKIILQQDIPSSEAGRTFRGGTKGKRALVIESDNPRKPATLQFSYLPDQENPTPFWAGLTIEGGSVTFRGIHFSLKASHTPQQLVAGVVVKGGQVVFDRCTFSQETPDDEELIGSRPLQPIASVAAWNATLAPMMFHHCWFPSGQAAVSIKGSGKVEQDDCAFGPLSCLFHLWGQENHDKAEVFLRHVSAQVVNGPVFRVDDNVSCLLGVQYSIFSCPNNGSLVDRPDLIRQTGGVRALKFEGKRNAYHQLLSFWARPNATKDEVEGANWQTFKKWLASSGGSDAGSSELKVNPWPRGLEADRRAAFSIDPLLPELRQENDKKNRPIGVESCIWEPLYLASGLPPLDAPAVIEPTVKLGPRERLVDPLGTASGPRFHKKLEAAISEAEQDDVILIKHNGELRIDPIVLSDGRRVKLRPYGNCTPILTLGKSIGKTPALLHLHHSQIEFEQIEFLLRTDPSYAGQSVVSMKGDSICRFDRCVITLDGGDSLDKRLEVVTLIDPRLTVKAPELDSKYRAEVKFKACLVRGRGDLVDIGASRPFGLEIDSSLVCLAGSLLTVHALAGEALPADSRSGVRLNKTTVFLTEPAFHLVSGKMGRGLVMSQVTATGCLFGLPAAKPLVWLEGLENDSQVKKILSWSGATNAFAGFDRLLEQTAADGGTSFVYQVDDWSRFSDARGEKLFERAALQPAADVERPFPQWLPIDFRQRAELSNYGAIIDQLPRPAVSDAGG